jgi:Tol biopolymer transport system component
MALTSGTKLGPYEIQSALGAGGMGEVYRAKDTRLDRTVAIKILPAHLSNDPVRKQRFEREAKTISSLNHPHICVLHDIGHQDGIDYLVMECVEGETLAKRLEKGPLSLEQVLKYGAQIADALDKAHRSGVVHRDLKPGNIVLGATGAKLLDFGLAKPVSPLVSGMTLTADTPKVAMTEEGTIVGTFQYMSPEQVEGKELDGRSDIFSLGAVLYEMVTGHRAFEGKSQLSVASAILEKEPEPITSSKPLTPAALNHSIRKCLEKLPDERWQSARDLASELNWISEGASQAREAERAPAKGRKWERVGWLAAAGLFLMMLAAGGAWWRISNRRPQLMYFHAAVPFAANDLALSPDGRTLAIAAYLPQADSTMLWTYEVGSRKVNAVDGTQGATFPFWSPDAKFIAFFAAGKLKKVEASGGQPQVLCDAPNGRGGAWNRDGVILFSPDGIGALFRTSSSGSPPVEITKLDTLRLETSHRWPVFLPDGRHFLYLAANFSGQLENNAVFLGSLDSQERRFLVSTSANAAYAEPGYLLYVRDDKTLVAQAIDHRRYILTGEAHNLSDGVLYFPTVDRAVFSASTGEVLVAQTGKGAFVSQLTWFDRTGKTISTLGPPGAYGNVRISPAGHFVATSQISADGRSSDIWILESARAATTRLTFGPAAHQTPVWSPDGKQVLFVMNRNLGQQLYLKNVDGSGSEEEVVELSQGRQANPWDWSRDGKYILCRRSNEVWYLTWPDRVAKPLLQAKWTVLNAQLSPDGRWVAYASNETGSMEIYVSPFPSVNGKWQVSDGGGQEPRWRQDGKELFYVSADGKMMSVGVTTGASFKAGTPVTLFQTHRRQPVSAQDAFSYDVSSDGQKFLIITRMDEVSAAPPSVLLNWASEMEK